MKKLTGKLALIFSLVAIVAFSAFTFIACSKNSSSNDSSSSDKTYTYTSEDTTPISNMNFDYATDELAYTSFPYSTSTWNRSLDNGAKTSQVSSGVIDVSEAGWKVLTETLYNDADFRGFAGNKYSTSGYPTSKDAKSAAIRSYYVQKYGQEAADALSITDDNMDELFKEFVISTFETSVGISRPVRDGMTDSKVYMLNNYMSNSSNEFGFGTAQIITSASTVTLEKGKYAKVSVYVMTQAVSGKNADGEYGANIRIANSIKGNSQAQYRISNIVTDGEWKDYTVYIHADEQYDTTFNLVFGLGYGNGTSSDGLYYTEGTAYFDSVTYEVLDDLTALDGKTVFGDSALDFNSRTPLSHDAREFNETANYFYYDLSMDAAFAQFPDYVVKSDAIVNGFNTTDSTGKTAVSIGYAEDTATCVAENEDGYKVSGLNYSAYSVKIESDKFVLNNGEYAVVSMKIKNRLSKLLGSTDVKLSVYDVFGETSQKRADLVSISDVSDEYKTVTLVIKNNFANAENDGREFYVLLEIGPASSVAFTTLANRTKFACGEVYFTSPTIAKGNFRDEEAETADLYSFLVSVADKEQALYAGYTADYTEESESEASCAFTPSSGNLGEITAYPTNLQNYKGIVSNHIYVSESADATRTINTRSGAGENGSFAGLINTKYLADYSDNTGLDIEGALSDAYTNDIQPLMIYNKELDHYGFIGENSTISASANAQFSVKVRVIGDAKAYIYLINTANEGKDVLSFATFTSNGKTYRAADLKYAIAIDSTMMDDSGWVTVNFYIANGKNEKNVRLEIWNGGRDGEDATASQGYVFFNNVKVTTSGAFTEPKRFADTFTDATTPLGALTKNAFISDNAQLISYAYGEDAGEVSYVWAKNDSTIYSVLNTIEPVEETEEEESEEDTAKTGCAAQTDASTFWLSFSSILLAVVLIVAIIALFIKNVRRRRGKKEKVQSHYKVESRNNMLKQAREKNAKAAETEKVTETEETADENAETEEATEEVLEETSEENNGENVEETTLDDYVYGEVTDFGETETNEEKPEEVSENTESDETDKKDE